MHLLILGASGGCGRWATRLAAERGHQVRAVVRSGASFEPPAGVETIVGSVLEQSVVDEAVRDVDAVLCCLGLRRRHPANPWSRVTSPHDLVESTTRVLVERMRAHGVSRVVAISAGGVGDSRSKISPLLRWLFDHSNITIAYRDLDRMESTLAESGLDWHVVRPTTLSNGRHTGRASAVDRYGLFSRVSRANVADWMIRTAEGVERESRTPMIRG